jgi:putative transposase
LKRDECPWLYEVSAHVGQSALNDLNDAFERFFKGLNGEGPKSGYPRFKKRSERDSARLYEVALEERHVRLPLVGRVRLKETRSERGFKGRILSVTIRRRADRWFISVCVRCERATIEPKPVRRPHDIVGVDLGVRSAAVIHDGRAVRVVEPARALRRHLKKLARLNRRLARKQRGSRNSERAKLELARLHYRIWCLRRNHLHQLTGSLARTRSVIELEDLDVNAMRRNRHLALSIGDAGTVERKALAPEASGVKPASLKQEASGRRSNGRHTQSRVETLAGVVANGI